MKLDAEKSGNVFSDLMVFTEKEVSICPWIAELSFEEILNEIQSEIDEVRRAEGSEELGGELADLFRDILLAMIIAERDLEVKPVEQLIQAALDKVRRRKPWVEEGKRVTKEEAVAIWNMVKAEEKKGKAGGT